MEGYIKTNFLETHDNKINKIIGCGSLTDGEFKIEVHITNFLNDDYFALDINKGDKVEIIVIEIISKLDYLYTVHIHIIKTSYYFLLL